MNNAITQKLLKKNKAMQTTNKVYYGRVVFRNEWNGMYSAVTNKGMVYADTLRGIKKMIKEYDK